MRVLQLGKYYYPYMGGIENHLYLLCNEIRQRVPLEVVVCNSVPRTAHESIEGVSVIRCGELFNVASTSLCPTMPLMLSRQQYEIIHFHFPHPMGVMSYLASRKPSAHKVVITYHSDIVRQERLLKFYAPFMRRVMDRAATIICTSPNYIESSEMLQSYRDKCRVIPYGIDLTQFTETEKIHAAAVAIRARYRGPLLIGVGRLIYYKGFEYVIEAMRDIDAQLLIIGDGPLRSRLEVRARDCGVAERVHFLGEIHNQEITPYYYASDLFVFPSIARSEAFGIVQLEAMACRLPVVNTALDSGVPFVSRNEESGLTVEPKNSHAFAQAVNRLLADPAWMRRLGEAGRRRVEKEFSKEVMAAHIINLYQELLKEV
ncbi:MAG: glycosyltransferase [Acidobacteriota bacterium]